MKKVVLLLITFLVLPNISEGETYLLKLRTSRHSDFLRIVIEGKKEIISKAQVYQRGGSIIISIPSIPFSIQTEKTVIQYKKTKPDTIVFSPEEFRGLKVFLLEYPDRLVVDIYLKEKKSNVLTRPLPLEENEEKYDSPGIKFIVIDPGHGGYEYGLISGKYSEKNIVLDVAKKLSLLINSGSAESHLTRSSDHFLTLTERVEFVNSKDADVFISLHVGNHKEIVLYVPVITERVSEIAKSHLDNKGQSEYIEESLVLLNSMKEAIVSEFGDNMVLIRPLPYSILSKIQAPSLMIELPSFDDAKYNEKFKAESANAIYKGLYIYEEKKAR
jgi:N-acetylmuramoyl-L-alanine amidase